jgi:hypothetical protein
VGGVGVGEGGIGVGVKVGCRVGALATGGAVSGCLSAINANMITQVAPRTMASMMIRKMVKRERNMA